MHNEWPKPRPREVTQEIAEVIAGSHKSLLNHIRANDGDLAWARELGRIIAYSDYLAKAPYDDFSQQTAGIMTDEARMQIEPDEEALWTTLQRAYNYRARELGVTKKTRLNRIEALRRPI